MKLKINESSKQKNNIYLNLKNILIKLKDLTFIEYKNVVNKNKKL